MHATRWGWPILGAALAWLDLGLMVHYGWPAWTILTVVSPAYGALAILGGRAHE